MTSIEVVTWKLRLPDSEGIYASVITIVNGWKTNHTDDVNGDVSFNGASGRNHGMGASNPVACLSMTAQLGAPVRAIRWFHCE